MEKEPDDHLELPAVLKREPETNQAEFMKMSDVESVESEVTEPIKKVAKVKANGAAKPKAKPKAAVKAADKPKAKVAKPAKVKAKATAKPAKAKVAKPKAKGESKAEKDAFGLRKGSAKSLAAALYARKAGATLEEVKDSVGSIQLNVLKDLEAEGFTVDKAKEKRAGGRPVTRYWLKTKK